MFNSTNSSPIIIYTINTQKEGSNNLDQPTPYQNFQKPVHPRPTQSSIQQATSHINFQPPSSSTCISTQSNTNSNSKTIHHLNPNQSNATKLTVLPDIPGQVLGLLRGLSNLLPPPSEHITHRVHRIYNPIIQTNTKKEKKNQKRFNIPQKKSKNSIEGNAI